jgi:hypothetical protein
MRLYLALVHHPVLNRLGQIVTSAVTNVDIHDVTRSARTFEVERTFMVTPIQQQMDLIDSIRDRWIDGQAGVRHPRRREALKGLETVPSLETAIGKIEEQAGARPVVVATSARPASNMISFEAMSECVKNDERPHLLVFGTGWGLTPEIMEQSDLRLEPIYGPGAYNHLSVRAAIAIHLDRLVGGNAALRGPSVA